MAMRRHLCIRQGDTFRAECRAYLAGCQSRSRAKMKGEASPHVG